MEECRVYLLADIWSSVDFESEYMYALSLTGSWKKKKARQGENTYKK